MKKSINDKSYSSRQYDELIKNLNQIKSSTNTRIGDRIKYLLMDVIILIIMMNFGMLIIIILF